ncbi:hypothetical protein GCM10010365_57060 [Streptomyces poonensis]|uniref:Uncharacterized protein n=1 Tax=Streptomyces poonensis TaxID=68255 RepID=A0A918Q0E3_9ACTN|nr:hypothetical protein GCM10010365_57060 [Streptomyces poonensis]
MADSGTTVSVSVSVSGARARAGFRAGFRAGWRAVPEGNADPVGRPRVLACVPGALPGSGAGVPGRAAAWCGRTAGTRNPPRYGPVHKEPPRTVSTATSACVPALSVGLRPPTVRP